jgi:hypothetical protein
MYLRIEDECHECPYCHNLKIIINILSFQPKNELVSTYYVLISS